MKVKIIRYYQPDTTAKKFTYTSEPKCTLSPNNIDLHDVTLFCEDDSKESISDLQMPRTYVGENDAKYQKLFKMYKRAHPDKLGMDVTDEVIRIWRDTLERGKVDSVYREYMARLDRKIEKNAQYNIKACFGRYISPQEKGEKGEEKEREKDMEKEREKVKEREKEKEQEMQDEEERDEEVEKGVERGGTKEREKPSQDKNTKEIESKEKELAFLIEKRDLDQGQNAVSIAHRIKEVRQERDLLRKTLKRKQDNLKSVQKMRKLKKDAEEQLQRDNPDLAKALKVMMMMMMMMMMMISVVAMIKTVMVI